MGGVPLLGDGRLSNPGAIPELECSSRDVGALDMCEKPGEALADSESMNCNSYKIFLHGGMKGRVTSKGQVTIPKELRERFGIQAGEQVDFAAADDGIRLRKVVDRGKPLGILGCLKKELAGRSVAEVLEELRGPVELPRRRARKGKRV